MRAPLAADILIFARTLLTCPPSDRRRVAGRILRETEEAWAYVVGCGLAHPVFGDGSLMSRSLSLHPAAEPFADNADYLHALDAAIQALRWHYRS